MNSSLIRFLLIVSCLLTSCAFTRDDAIGTPVVTEESYDQGVKDNAVVLLEVNWGRVWGCAKFENAQILTFTFDRMPSDPKKTEADFVITTPSRLSVHPVYIGYAFMLPPGRYALSQIRIKVASPGGGLGLLGAGREKLIQEGKPLGGDFQAHAGEAVYIGSFGLDCYQQPMLWRYYRYREDFDAYIANLKKEYPFLDLSNVVYRLFDTTLFGKPYEPKSMHFERKP